MAWVIERRGEDTMDFREYVEEKKQLYEDFAKAVASIVDAAISARTDIARPLLIKHRAKAEDSLRLKLEPRGLSDSKSIDTEIKDLAGCRLVFYTDGDKKEFLRTGLIFDHFAVDREETKVHHPVPGEPSEDAQYRGTHYIVSLSDEQLALPEYAKFAGLRCEIQIQTLLHHAWSETSHNVTYKSNLLPGFGRRQLDEIKQRLDSVMKQYLVPAGYEIQKVKNDALLLERGNEILSRDPISQLLQATDNNERVELLTSLKESVLPYCDDPNIVYPRLWEALPKVIQAARQTEAKPIETAIGNFDGKTAYDVTAAAVDIVDFFRYYDVSKSLSIYCDIFPGALDSSERKRILDAVNHLAAHTRGVWLKVGPYAQSVLLKELVKFDAAQRRALRPIILCVCAKALEPDVSGTSSPSYDKISFHRGSVKVSDALREARSGALSLLEILYRESGNEEEKRQAFDRMLNATSHPSSAIYENDLIELTVQNTRRIVEFSLQHHEAMCFELLQHIEYRFLWLYQNVPSWAAKCDIGVQQQAAELVAQIAAFRDAINADLEFERHKTLVGFEPVFAQDWDAHGPDFRRTDVYRLAKIDEYINSVNADNAEEWLRIIKRCAATRSNDGATFKVFLEFLTRFSTARPDIMLRYLADIPEVLVGFLPDILKGLELSPSAKQAEALMERWIAEACHLGPIGRHLRSAKTTYSSLITAMSRSAIEAKDRLAVREAAAVIVARPDLAASPLVDEVFVPSIRFLTGIEDTSWVDEAWYQPSMKSFFSALTEAQAQAVLNNLVHRPKIDNDAEMILIPIANFAYSALWHFFGARLRHKDDAAKGYEPIPLKFYRAAPALGKVADCAIDTVREWYVEDDPMFELTGGKLLAIAFPDCSDALRAKLIAIIEADGVASFPFVCGILKNYQDNIAIQPICQALIDCLPEEDERLNTSDILLLNMGVVSGEFGMVEAYKRKRDEVANWSNDPRPKVRNFAARYVRDLNRQIAAEQSTSEQSLELRKLDWNSRADE